MAVLLPLLLLTACSREDDYDVPEGKGALLVSLENPAEGIAAEDVAFYLCHPDGRPLFSLTYGNPRELSAEPIPLDPGDYLLAVVANASPCPWTPPCPTSPYGWTTTPATSPTCSPPPRW